VVAILIDDLVKNLLKTSKKYDKRRKLNISLVGHTDHVGTDDYNFDLGMLRAIAVRQQLQIKLKVQLGNLLRIINQREKETGCFKWHGCPCSSISWQTIATETLILSELVALHRGQSNWKYGKYTNDTRSFKVSAGIRKKTKK
jgi:hypothetical protein